MIDLEFALTKAKEAAFEAGKIVLDICNKKDFCTEYKADGSPVTKADKEAEEKILEILLTAFPQHSFRGEEAGLIGSAGSSYLWTCDPVDGTRAILNGEKTSSISLALSNDNNTILGLVYNPFTKEMYSAAENIKTMLNDMHLPKQNKESPENSVYNFQISSSRKLDVLALYGLWETKKIGKLVSSGGSVAYSLAQVAEGAHNVYVLSSRKIPEIWDVEAGIYLVRSVGGEVTNFNDKGVMVASTNPILHKKTLELLRSINFDNIYQAR